MIITIKIKDGESTHVSSGITFKSHKNFPKGLIADSMSINFEGISSSEDLDKIRKQLSEFEELLIVSKPCFKS